MGVHHCTMLGHIDLVKYLILTLKCNPNVRDNDGKTPLHMICSSILSEPENSMTSLIENSTVFNERSWM